MIAKWPTDIFPQLYWPVIVLILSITVIVRVWDVGDTNLWSDEVLTSFRAQGTLEELLKSLYRVGNQAPFYYLVMQLLPNSSPFLMRVPSILFGILGVALTIHVVWKLYPNRVLALWMGGLLAVNPMHVILSRTARYYTLLFVLAIIVIYCFILLTRGKESRTIWGAFVFSSMLAYLTHYSVLALPVTQLLMLVYSWRTQRQLLWRWAFAQVVAGLPLLAWMVLTMSQSHTKTPLSALPQYARIQDIPLSFMNILMGYDGVSSWLILPGLTIAVMGFSIGIVCVLRKRHIHPELIYWLILSFVPLGVLYFVNQVDGINYRDRYLLFSMPAVHLLFWYGWEHSNNRIRQVALGAILVTSSALTLNMFASSSYERTDWEAAGQSVVDDLRPGDRLLFERDFIYTAFSTYFPGDLSALAEQSLILLDQPDTTRFEQESNRIWVIYRTRHEDFHRAGWVEDLDPLTDGLSPISTWLVEHKEQIVFQQPFKGGVIFLIDPAEN